MAGVPHYHLLWFNHLVVLAIEVQIGKCTVGFEFEAERTGALRHPTSASSDVSLISQAPLILETDELDNAIRVAVLPVLLTFVDEIGTITIGMPPDVRHPSHVVVDIHCHDITVLFFDPHCRLLRKKYLCHFPARLFIQWHCIFILHLHLGDYVSDIFYCSKPVEATDQEIQNVVDNLLL